MRLLSRTQKIVMYSTFCYNSHMNDDTIQDLKQFISATVSQQTTEIRDDISGIHHDISGMRDDISGIRVEISDVRVEISDVRSDIKSLDNKMSTKIDDLSKYVAGAMDTSNETNDTQLKDHELRIGRLEKKPA